MTKPQREATGLSVAADDEKAIAAKVEREQAALRAALDRDRKAVEATRKPKAAKGE